MDSGCLRQQRKEDCNNRLQEKKKDFNQSHMGWEKEHRGLGNRDGVGMAGVAWYPNSCRTGGFCKKLSMPA